MSETKTKILVCGRQKLDTNIIVISIKHKNVDGFTYFESERTNDGKSSTNNTS